MHREGHYGVALLLYTPVAAIFLNLGLDWYALGGVVILLATATLPDIDLRIPFIQHRGITHTVWFAAFVGLVVTSTLEFAAVPLGDPRFPAATFCGAVTTYSILTHIAGDALTPMGIRPFAPLLQTSYSARLFYSSSKPANYGFLVAGTATFLAIYLGRMYIPL